MAISSTVVGRNILGGSGLDCGSAAVFLGSIPHKSELRSSSLSCDRALIIYKV